MCAGLGEGQQGKINLRGPYAYEINPKTKNNNQFYKITNLLSFVIILEKHP